MTLRPSASSDSVLSDFSHLDVTSLTSDLSRSSLSLDSTRETTSPGLPAGEKSENNDDSSSCPSVREKPRRTSRLFLRRVESLRRRNREKETVATGVSTEETFRGTGLSLHCTPDASLPGLSANKRSVAKDTAWKSHTICRTNISQSEAPVQPHRACLYLEDYQLAWEKPKLTNHSLFRKEGPVIHLPSDHKPGTFPRSLSIESLCPAPLSECSDQIGWPGEDGDFSLGGGSSCSASQDFLSGGFGKRRNSVGSIGSIYDNVPEISTEEGNAYEEETAFQHLDDILQQVHGLQHNIAQWSHSLSQQLRDPSNSESESTAETTLPSSLPYEDHSVSDLGMTVSDYESAGNSLNDGDGDGEMRERRDSGVGASLTRPSR